VEKVKAQRPEALDPAADTEPLPSGRVDHDERGNAVWKWADEEPLARIDSLQLADGGGVTTEASDKLGHEITVVPAKGGYNPYESGLVKKTDASRKRDLRTLSKWIEERRQLGKPTKF